jgi:hypothetical protein
MNKTTAPGLQVQHLELRTPQALSPRQAQALGQAFADELVQALAPQQPAIGQLSLGHLVLELGAAPQRAELRRAAAEVARRILDRCPE